MTSGPARLPVTVDSEWYFQPPHTIYYAATYACRRSCAYCNLHSMVKTRYGSHRRARAQEMDLATVRRVLDEARSAEVQLVKISGGEPFERTDMFEIVAYGIELGLTILPITRHTFSQADADRLAATGLTSIAFSFDSLRPETNRRLHGSPGLGKELLDSITRLVARGVRPHITAVITQENEAEYPELVRTFKEIGALSVSPTMLVGPTFTLRSEGVGSFDAALCLDRVVVGARERLLLRINDAYGMPSEIPDVPRQYGSVCPAADTAFISPDGYMCYCGQTTDLFFGNLKRRGLMDVWTSAERRRLMRPTREMYEGTECESCDLFDDCNSLGRCYYSTIMRGPFYRAEPGRLCKRVGRPPQGEHRLAHRADVEARRR